MTKEFLEKQKIDWNRAIKSLNAASKQWAKLEAPKINKAIEAFGKLKF